VRQKKPATETERNVTDEVKQLAEWYTRFVNEQGTPRGKVCSPSCKTRPETARIENLGVTEHKGETNNAGKHNHYQYRPI